MIFIFSEEFLPTDPMQLSYWVIQNFLLSRKERLDTLTQNCSIQRLKLLLEQIQTRRNICCARCNKKLASQEELFPMSKDGLQNNFVNPGNKLCCTRVLENPPILFLFDNGQISSMRVMGLARVK